MAISIEKTDAQVTLCKDEKSEKVEKMKADILSICQTISSPSSKFEAKVAFNEIKNYVHSYDRLLYAEISTYCYNLEPEGTDSFQGNLNSLIEYVFSQDYENGLKAEQGKNHQVEVELRERSKRVVVKLYDNVNLACAQMSSLKQSKEDLHEHFISEFEPAKADITKDISSQLITLVGIFTAIAFLVFGGFSSLTDIFAHIEDNIIKTVMLASIWGLIVCNGVFIFLSCIEKIAKKETAELYNYSVFKWTNIILLFAFFNSLWAYIVDRYDWGYAIVKIGEKASEYIAIIGFALSLLVFVIAAHCIFKRKKK